MQIKIILVKKNRSIIIVKNNCEGFDVWPSFHKYIYIYPGEVYNIM